MAETKRLGVWGWFVRAFAAGFGAMCGMIAAAVVAGAVSYALIAAGVLAFASLGGIEFNTGGSSTPVAPAVTTLAPAPTTVLPAPHVGSSYGGNEYRGSDPYTLDPVQAYPASPSFIAPVEADNEAPAAEAQPVAPVITIPSDPTTSPADGSSPALE